MDEISSSEFRKTYASLTKPTIVRVGKHAIGEWWPVGTIYRTFDSPETDRPASIPVTPGPGYGTAVISERFNSQPFTGPIPKKGK